jgi:hypothetical protein
MAIAFGHSALCSHACSLGSLFALCSLALPYAHSIFASTSLLAHSLLSFLFLLFLTCCLERNNSTTAVLRSLFAGAGAGAAVSL